MRFLQKFLCTSLVVCVMVACKSKQPNKEAVAGNKDTVQMKNEENVALPAPYATKSVMNFSDVTGWPEGTMPKAPEGFMVSKFAEDLKNPRWIYVANNGDIFVSEAQTGNSGIKKKVTNAVTGKSKSENSSGGNDILLFRDADGDGVPEVKQVFLSGLNQPFGMLIIGNKFYVGNTDGLMMFPYTYGQTRLTAPGKKILELPAGGYNNHWTRNLITNSDSSKIFISVGSGSNVGEHGPENEIRRANILEINPDGSGEKIYANGLRNPVGMGWAPGTSTLWTAVNERDELGDELVPDYVTSVKEGAFYGWPYSYFGQHEDPRRLGERPDLVKKAVVPDVALGSHTASLGLAFDTRNSFGPAYGGGAFIGQHGSWNRSKLSGYQVVFIPFKGGKPAGAVQPFLTGFIEDAEGKKVYGRPVGVAFTKAGALLVADDAANTIWCVKKK